MRAVRQRTDVTMLDWDDLRFFLAVARQGTLAAAAKQLHVTQSTVGRRLAAMQASLGVRLLQQTGTGYALTLAGESIRAHVERVETEALSVERAVAGHDIRIDGVVRVASSQIITSHLLTPCYAALHAHHPGILVEALPDGPGDPLTSQDADIAVRLRRFDHGDLLVRSLGALGFGLYACIAYLARFGQPDFAVGCAGHRLITLRDEGELSIQAAWLTEHASRAQVVLRADSYETQHSSAICAGGLALLPRFRGDMDPALRRIPTPEPVPPAEIWLAVHRENRAVQRVRTVLDAIAESVRGKSGSLHPED
jgi:DNA-binding transcriptional LysR family regulator